MTHSQAEQIQKLVWQEAGFRVYQKSNGDLVDHNGHLLTLNEEANVRACLNYKSAD